MGCLYMVTTGYTQSETKPHAGLASTIVQSEFLPFDMKGITFRTTADFLCCFFHSKG